MITKKEFYLLLNEKIAENVFKMKGLKPIPFSEIIEILYASDNEIKMAFQFRENYKYEPCFKHLKWKPNNENVIHKLEINNFSYTVFRDEKPEELKEFLVSREIVTQEFIDKLSTYMSIQDNENTTDKFCFTKRSFPRNILYFSMEKFLCSLENELLEFVGETKLNKIYFLTYQSSFLQKFTESKLIENVTLGFYQPAGSNEKNGIINLQNLIGNSQSINMYYTNNMELF